VVSLGADKSARDGKGRSPFDWAPASSQDVRDLLRP